MPECSFFCRCLDEGTTSAGTGLYDEQGRRIELEACAVPSYYPQAAGVEQEPEEIWGLQLKAVRQGTGENWSAVAIGIKNQRETTIVGRRFALEVSVFIAGTAIK